jgi:hypothetical protein
LLPSKHVEFAPGRTTQGDDLSTTIGMRSEVESSWKILTGSAALTKVTAPVWRMLFCALSSHTSKITAGAKSTSSPGSDEWVSIERSLFVPEYLRCAKFTTGAAFEKNRMAHSRAQNPSRWDGAAGTLELRAAFQRPPRVALGRQRRKSISPRAGVL